MGSTKGVHAPAISLYAELPADDISFILPDGIYNNTPVSH